MFGIAIGVMALIVVISVMNGFEEDIKAKLLGTQSHIVIASFADGLAHPEQAMVEIAKDPDVIGVTPFILSEGLLSGAGGVRGVVIRGVDPKTAIKVIRLKEIMTQGQYENLSDAGILVGSELSRKTGIAVSDTVTLISPTGTITPLGMIPKSMTFVVKGLFSTGMYEYDSTMVYISLPAAKRLFMKESPTGIEVKIRDIYAADAVSKRLLEKIGPGFWAHTWKDMNKSLFSALKMEKIVMYIILLFIILVAVFSIVSTLIMLVMEKHKDIAILKSMGATSSQILGIFVTLGMVIGLSGTVIGVGLGLALANNLNPIVHAVEWLFHVQVMPQDVYYITGLPTKIYPLEVSFIAVSALILSFLATIYPARQAARQDPVEVLRYEG
jgi:lipoprotein-releasing system permease protein